MLILLRSGLLLTVSLLLGCTESQDAQPEPEDSAKNNQKTMAQAAAIGAAGVTQVIPKQSQPLSQAAAIATPQTTTETYEVPNRFPTPQERESARKDKNKKNTSNKPDPIN
jgi:hypothetical protein